MSSTSFGIMGFRILALATLWLLWLEGHRERGMSGVLQVQE